MSSIKCPSPSKVVFKLLLLILRFPIAVIVQARSGSSESEAMLGIVDDTEEKSQKDQVVTASKPSKPLSNKAAPTM